MTKNVSAGDLIKKLFTEKIIYVVLLALIIVIICIEPRFLSIINFSNILAQSSTRIIIALGAGMVLMVRGCDLSTGRMIGLAAVISASLLQDVDYAYRMYQNLPSLPIIVPLIYFDREPYGAQPIGGIKESLTKLCTRGVKIGSFRLPYLTIIAILVIVFMWILWNKTKFGKYMYAVGGNPDAAQVSGVNVSKILIATYALAAVMYAVAAVLEVGRIGSASNTTGNSYEMDAIASCVVGGVSMSGGIGTVGGIVTGVLIFTVINYGLSFIGVNMYWQYIVKGLIILLAVVVDMRKFAKRK